MTKKPRTRKILRLRQVRKSRDWSLGRVAAQAKVDRSYLSLIESGRRKPTLQTAQDIAAVFEMSVDELFQLVEVPA